MTAGKMKTEPQIQPSCFEDTMRKTSSVKPSKLKKHTTQKQWYVSIK